jgi:hypothetical protein
MNGDREKVNETIEHMINHFNKYMTKMSDRLKINSLFNEFEDKARNDLISLVKLSNTRYKGVKSGNSLDNVVQKQLPNYRQIINSAITDDFYLTEEIFQEKKKFKKMNNRAENSEIAILRQTIKENVKSLNMEENGQNIYEAVGEHKAANIKFLERLKKIKSPTMQELNTLNNTNLTRRKDKVNQMTIGKAEMTIISESDNLDSKTDRINKCKF